MSEVGPACTGSAAVGFQEANAPPGFASFLIARFQSSSSAARGSSLRSVWYCNDIDQASFTPPPTLTPVEIRAVPVPKLRGVVSLSVVARSLLTPWLYWLARATGSAVRVAFKSLE